MDQPNWGTAGAVVQVRQGDNLYSAWLTGSVRVHDVQVSIVGIGFIWVAKSDVTFVGA